MKSIDWNTGVALLLAGDAVSVGEMDLGRCLFHDGIDILTPASDDVRVDSETHLHRYFRRIILLKSSKRNK